MPFGTQRGGLGSGMTVDGNDGAGAMSKQDELRDKAERMVHAVEMTNALIPMTGPNVMDDAGEIAKAWLAEHPADDGELISNEWLESLGCKPVHWQSGTIDWDVPADEFKLTIRVWENGVRAHPDAILENARDSGNFQKEVVTRGDVRLLCKFLGMPLVEVAK